MKDAFGIEIEQGDMILSASTSRGTVKVGTVLLREGMVPAMVPHATNKRSARISPLGSALVVLRKADGSIPSAVREAFE